MINITDYERKIVLDIIKKFIPNCTVKIFGSRCNGKNKIYSDLDMAIISADKNKIPLKLLGQIKNAFEESNLNFRVDVLDWYRVSDDFKKVVDSNCEIIYSNQIYSLQNKKS